MTENDSSCCSDLQDGEATGVEIDAQGRSLILIPDHVAEGLGGDQFLEQLFNAFAAYDGPVVLRGPKELLDQIRAV